MFDESFVRLFIESPRSPAVVCVGAWDVVEETFENLLILGNII